MASLDDVFDILSKERRRYALYYLQEADGKVPVDELIETVVSWENEGTVDAPAEEELRRAKLTFEHVHLPKAADVEFVEYRPEDRSIEVRGLPPEYETIVTIAKLIEQPN